MQRGFTLIEILIVLVIISIITTVALLTMGRNENKQLEAFTKDLGQIVSLAEEQAMLQTSTLGLSLNEHSFYFNSYELLKDKQIATWIPLDDRILGKHVIPKEIEVKLDIGGHDEKLAHLPQVIISTSGDITPFTIYVGKKGQKPRYALIGEANGSITQKLLS